MLGPHICVALLLGMQNLPGPLSYYIGSRRISEKLGGISIYI